jgi:Tol biopolymer transport system component
VRVDVAGDTEIDLPIPDATLERPKVSAVTFSPDGRSIAWTINNQGKNEMSQVWVTDNEGRYPRLLASEEGRTLNPRWHPGGTQVIYSLTKERQNPQIRLLSAESGEFGSLFSSSKALFYPAWSPDGVQVAMTQCEHVTSRTAFSDRQCNVSVLDRGNNLITPLAELPGRLYLDNAWSPDGTLLAFISAQTEELHAVWVCSPERLKCHPVTGYMKPFSGYAWLPYNFVDVP